MFQIGDKITIKKIDKRFKHPDTRIWEVVAVKWCECNNEKMYDLVEVIHRLDMRYDCKEHFLVKNYIKIVENEK